MSKWVRRTLYGVGGLVGLVVLTGAGLFASSSMKILKKYDVPLTELPIPNDSATIARGKHLATAIGKCVDCHMADFGGSNFIDDPALGTVPASNLTRGGVGALYTDAELIRAIRHGVKRD